MLSATAALMKMKAGGGHPAKPSKVHMNMLRRGISKVHGTHVGGYNPSHHQLLKKANYAINRLPSHAARKMIAPSAALAYSPISAATKTRR